MSQPSRPVLPPEAIAGAAALVSLLTLVFAFHIGFLRAMMGAVIVYVAVTLVSRKPDAAPPSPSLPDTLAELTALGQKIAAHALRQQLAQLVSQARGLMNHLHQSPDTAPWQDYLRELLTVAVTGTSRFAAHTPHLTDPDHPAVAQFTAFLAALSQTLDSVHQQVTGDAPAAPTDADKAALADISNAYLGEGQ